MAERTRLTVLLGFVPAQPCPSTDAAGAQEVTSGAAAKSANMSIAWFSLSQTQPQILFLVPLTSVSQHLCGDGPSNAMQTCTSRAARATKQHRHTLSWKGVCKGSPCSSSRCSQSCWHCWADPNAWHRFPLCCIHRPHNMTPSPKLPALSSWS